MKLNHLLIPYLALLGFVFGGFISSSGISWYETLTLPAGHPTLPLIALIWAVIFICAAWSMLYIWNKVPHGKEQHELVALFLIIVAANLLWSATFFLLHFLDWSVWIATLISLAAFLLSALLLHRHSVEAGLLMLPYAVWVAYAAFLTNQVALLNP